VKIEMGLAPGITKNASTQAYYTIRLLVDRERVANAFRAYAYFRWVDDILDAESGSGRERCAFIERQKSLIERCYRGISIGGGNRRRANVDRIDPKRYGHKQRFALLSLQYDGSHGL
jgi:hypothetical protein